METQLAESQQRQCEKRGDVGGSKRCQQITNFALPFCERERERETPTLSVSLFCCMNEACLGNFVQKIAFNCHATRLRPSQLIFIQDTLSFAPSVGRYSHQGENYFLFSVLLVSPPSSFFFFFVFNCKISARAIQMIPFGTNLNFLSINYF